MAIQLTTAVERYRRPRGQLPKPRPGPQEKSSDQLPEYLEAHEVDALIRAAPHPGRSCCSSSSGGPDSGSPRPWWSRHATCRWIPIGPPSACGRARAAGHRGPRYPDILPVAQAGILVDPDDADLPGVGAGSYRESGGGAVTVGPFDVLGSCHHFPGSRRSQEEDRVGEFALILWRCCHDVCRRHRKLGRASGGSY